MRCCLNSSTGTVSGTVRSGNPISYYNGTHWTFAWQNGRRLASTGNGTTSISYTYDLSGLRTSKTVGIVEHRYVYASGRLLRETYGNVTLDFSYGINGTPYSMTYTDGSAAPVTYYYITNLQNDVIYMVTASGTKVAEYSYDPYGKVTIATGSMANINPLRYRGYYFDSETGFYYLQSRYYDPTICRFINADFAEYTSLSAVDIRGTSLFAYCQNSPVVAADEDGEWLNIVIGAVVGGAVAAITTAVQTYKATGSVDLAKTLISGAVGAVSGGIVAKGLGVLVQAGITAGTTFIGDVATRVVCEGKNLKATPHTILVRCCPNKYAVS